MTAQDRDVLVVCLISGFGFVVTMLGLGWAAVGLYNIATKIKGA